MSHLALRDPAGTPNATRRTIVPLRRIEHGRTVASVLFADVQQSMPICQRLSPEDWWSLMAGIYDVLSDGICRFGGRVELFTGDGVMAVFETPLNHDGHANRACRAAAWCRDSIIAHAATLDDRQGELSLAMRIGIDSGDVVVGMVGGTNGAGLTTMGYTAALAKRVEGLARPGTVYVTERTATAAGLDVATEDLGEHMVNGAAGPVRIHRLR